MKLVKPLLIMLVAMVLSVPTKAQDKKEKIKIYDEQRDAMEQIDQAIDLASQSGKYVLCQVGGNWCPWCLRFAAYADTNQAVRNVIDSNFVYIHVNYSKANKNPEAMQRLGNPARFGFPVFVILDEAGNVMHIQSSGYLEEGKSYSERKVVDFLSLWTRKAVETLR